MGLSANSIARLRSQMARAEVVLFTGAGFSVDAENSRGQKLPTTAQLKQQLWRLCYPDQEHDPTSTLGELFDVAKKRRRAHLIDFLESRFSVHADSLSDYYRPYWSMPWLRVYTLNIDDLALAAARKFQLDRVPTPISATSADRSYVPRGRHGNPSVEVVHLNGALPDPPESLTFSETQYAERIANKEPWYARCVADLVSRPVIFIGTDLREVPLWQHMELRKLRVKPRIDRRAGSILVTPTLSPSRQELLQELRVEWFSGTVESFAVEVMGQLGDARRKGFEFLGDYSRSLGRTTLQLTSDLAADNPSLETGYLAGEEPHWSDVLTGRAIEREFDVALYGAAMKILKRKRPATALLVSGTAGTGKSTVLMRLALTLSAEGIPVFWVDRDTRVTPHGIRKRVLREKSKVALVIDDADVLGRQASGLLHDLVPAHDRLLCVVSARSTKVATITDSVARENLITLDEKVVPGLTDEDIEKLISVLDKFHRLGILKGKSAAERRRAFANQAGRQLLVAMINATSGERFEEKAKSELTELAGTDRYIYSIVCLASSLGHYLTKDEVLLAAGSTGSEAAEALDALAARHVLVSRPPTYEYRARHRVIAELVQDRLQALGELKDVVVGLAFAASSKVNPAMGRHERPWRLLNRLMSHDFLGRVVGVMDAREVYEAIEGLVAFDYHYWLQRGSLEVHRGDLGWATQYLNQARSLSPNDYLVQTTYAYLQMRKASESPDRHHARDFFEEGMAILESVITEHGRTTPYPFHVMGSQGLHWSRSEPTMTGVAKREFLGMILERVRTGCGLHPGSKQLKELVPVIEREILYTVTVRSRGSTPV